MEYKGNAQSKEGGERTMRLGDLSVSGENSVITEQREEKIEGRTW